MTRSFRASAVVTVAATFIALSSAHGALADGRADWTGYAWQKIDISDCPVSGGVLPCPPYHQKWDWKRNQWVDILVEIDLVGGRLHLTQRLSDLDEHDSDYVCVTALAVDASGKNVLAHHQNWQMHPGAVQERSFSYDSDALQRVTTLHIGSKQCRDGARQDDALYARVLTELQF